MLAGKKVTPCCHWTAFILSIIHNGNEGSSIAMPILANVMAPDKRDISFKYQKRGVIWEARRVYKKILSGYVGMRYGFGAGNNHFVNERLNT